MRQLRPGQRPVSRQRNGNPEPIRAFAVTRGQLRFLRPGGAVKGENIGGAFTPASASRPNQSVIP